MFITKKKHEAEVADLKTAVTYWRDRAEKAEAESKSDWSAGDVDSEGNRLVVVRQDEIETMERELERFRNGRARSNAALAASNAARSEAARGKGA